MCLSLATPERPGCPSGVNSTLGTRPFFRHARERGHPDLAPGLNTGRPAQCPTALDPRFAGATRKGKREPSVWFAPLDLIFRGAVTTAISQYHLYRGDDETAFRAPSLASCRSRTATS